MAQILSTGYQRSGKNSRVITNGTTLNFAKYDVDSSGDDQDTTNFESDGVEEGILGVQLATISFGGDWDAHANPYDDPPGLYPRDDLPNTYFYPNVTDGLYWLFPYARIRSATNGSEVRGKVSFNASGKNQGPFTDPTGSV